MPTICHFEVPADDIQRAKKFYEQLFGWKIELFPQMEYYGIDTGAGDKGVCGGLMKRQQPQQPILNYINCECVDSYSQKVKDLGGQVVMGKTAVPGMGWFAICLDSENNAFGLWESDANAK